MSTVTVIVTLRVTETGPAWRGRLRLGRDFGPEYSGLFQDQAN